MNIIIDGTKYHMQIKRGKKLLRLFFKTQDGLFDHIPFHFLPRRSDNIMQRLIEWKAFKYYLIHGCSLRCTKNCKCTISKVQLIPA